MLAAPDHEWMFGNPHLGHLRIMDGCILETLPKPCAPGCQCLLLQVISSQISGSLQTIVSHTLHKNENSGILLRLMYEKKIALEYRRLAQQVFTNILHPRKADDFRGVA